MQWHLEFSDMTSPISDNVIIVIDNVGIVIANMVDMGGMGIIVVNDLGDVPHHC